MSPTMDPWSPTSHADDIDPWSIRHHEDDAAKEHPEAKPAATKPTPEAAPQAKPAEPLDFAPLVQAIAEMADDISNAINALTAAIRERLPPPG